MQIVNHRRASNPPASTRGPRHRRAPRIGVLFSAAMVAALIAGCGGSSPNGNSVAAIKSSSSGGVTHADTSSTATSSSTRSTTPARTAKPRRKPSALAFAKCMRAHGVPSFPDPNSSGKIPIKSSGGMTRAPSGGFTANPNSPAYETASKDCRPLAMATPVTQAQSNELIASQLKFAVCMRKSGVPNYPDPTSTGEVGNNGAISGVNPNSPAVQRAEKTCSHLLTPPPSVPGGGPPAPSGNG